MELQVKDLQIGDVLTTGEIVSRTPYLDDSRFAKNKIRVTLSNNAPSARYAVETKIFNQFKTVTIINR